MVPSCCLFLHRLIEVSTTVSKLHHHIHLNVEAREDIIWWNRFLPSWNGVSIFLDPNWKDAEAIHLFTDASGTLGYGADFNGAWFRGDWLPHPCGPFSGRSCLPSLQQPARGDISCNLLSLFSALAPQANPQPTLVPPQLAELRWRSSSAEHWPCPISTHTRPASGGTMTSAPHTTKNQSQTQHELWLYS